MTATHKLIEGVHILFVGGNKKPTYGITVRHIDEAAAKERGLRVQYDINDYSISRCDDWEWLDLGSTTIDDIRNDLEDKVVDPN